MKKFLILLIFFNFKFFLFAQDCFENSDCPDGYFCDKKVGDCKGEGKCQPMNTIPYPCYIPVCGCDGKTYSNPAVAAFNGVSIAYYGECIPFLKNNLYLYFLPAAASSKGANNSYWVSDLYILNLQDKEVELTFYFLEKGKENLNPKVANKNIPSSSLISIEDSLLNLFNEKEKSGSIFIEASFPVFISSYTYTNSEGKIYGEEMPVYEFTDIPYLIDCSGIALQSFIGSIQKNENFRANLGFINLYQMQNKINYSIIQDKETIYEDSINLEPFCFLQIDNFLKDIEISNISPFFISFYPNEKRFYSYLSLVDNLSNDGTFFPLLDIPSKELFIPIVAHSKGGYDTNWRSNVYLINSNKNDANIEILFYRNGSEYKQGIVLKEEAGIVLEDIVNYVLINNQEDIKGSLILRSDVPIFCNSKTYNSTSLGTYGQYIPSFKKEDLLKEGESAIIPYLLANDQFRTNIGFTSYEEGNSKIKIEIKDENANIFYQSILEIPSFGNIQLNISNFVPPNFKGFLAFEVIKGFSICGYSSVINNKTGDAIFSHHIKGK